MEPNQIEESKLTVKSLIYLMENADANAKPTYHYLEWRLYFSSVIQYGHDIQPSEWRNLFCGNADNKSGSKALKDIMIEKSKSGEYPSISPIVVAAGLKNLGNIQKNLYTWNSKAKNVKASQVVSYKNDTTLFAKLTATLLIKCFSSQFDIVPGIYRKRVLGDMMLTCYENMLNTYPALFLKKLHLDEAYLDLFPNCLKLSDQTCSEVVNDDLDLELRENEHDEDSVSIASHKVQIPPKLRIPTSMQSPEDRLLIANQKLQSLMQNRDNYYDMYLATLSKITEIETEIQNCQQEIQRSQMENRVLSTIYSEFPQTNPEKVIELVLRLRKVVADKCKEIDTTNLDPLTIAMTLIEGARDEEIISATQTMLNDVTFGQENEVQNGQPFKDTGVATILAENQLNLSPGLPQIPEVIVTIEGEIAKDKHSLKSSEDRLNIHPGFQESSEDDDDDTIMKMSENLNSTTIQNKQGCETGSDLGAIVTNAINMTINNENEETGFFPIDTTIEEAAQAKSVKRSLASAILKRVGQPNEEKEKKLDDKARKRPKSNKTDTQEKSSKKLKDDGNEKQ